MRLGIETPLPPGPTASKMYNASTPSSGPSRPMCVAGKHDIRTSSVSKRKSGRMRVSSNVLGISMMGSRGRLSACLSTPFFDGPPSASA